MGVLGQAVRVWTLCLAVWLAASAAWAQERRALPSQRPAAANRGAGEDRLAPQKPLDLSLGLPLRHRDALTNLLSALYDPASPHYRQFLSPEEFTARFGPTEADYEAVVAFARTNGLTVTARHPNRMVLSVRGAAAQAEAAFRVALRVYPHPTESRTFFAPDGDPSVPRGVPVQSVMGLSDFRRPQPHSLRRVNFSQCQANGGTGPGGTFRGYDFRNAYLLGVSLTGSGQAVGLVEFDGFYPSDITSYESLAGLPSVPLQTVLVDGFNGTPIRGPNAANSEVALDIEMCVALAPGLDKIVVYETNPDSPSNDLLNRIATDNLVRQISSSWNIPDADATTDQILQQFAAQGQSFLSASGDSGSGPLPAGGDKPYITTVGGTTLTTSTSGAWVSETVWNEWDGQSGSSGGSSSTYPLPAWQQGMDFSASGGSAAFRNVPDVALVADNIFIVADRGQHENIVGTSAAAPLWAAFTALVNQQAATNGLPPVGFLNPTLYRIARSPTYGAAFHDTTTGDNTTANRPNRYYAVPGYDLCTGWGTPLGGNLIAALASVPGAVTVTLRPTAAVTAGARWRVDEGAWQVSGATVSNLFVGLHTLTFAAPGNWSAPVSQLITVTAGGLTATGAAYTSPCLATLSPGGLTSTASGGSGVIQVALGSGCAWTAVSGVPWITIAGAATGMGAGAVSYSIAANSSTNTRQAMLQIGSQDFVVTQSGLGWSVHPLFGWLYDTGTGWLGGGAYGWLWFHPGGQWLWSSSLNGWLAVTDFNTRTLWSTQFRWLTLSAGDPYHATTTAIGPVYVGQYHGIAIPDGWVVSDRFGYVWAAGDGVWFWSEGLNSWLGVTPEGGIWCVGQGKFL